MNFINNDAKLRSFIPNVFSSVECKVSLFDKMKTHLQFAESWLEQSSLINVNLESSSIGGGKGKEYHSQLQIIEG